MTHKPRNSRQIAVYAGVFLAGLGYAGAFSSPSLEQGASLEVYDGGSSTGTVISSLYQDGTYTPGEEIAAFSISNVVTRIGNSTR